MLIQKKLILKELRRLTCMTIFSYLYLTVCVCQISDYDSIIRVISDPLQPFETRYKLSIEHFDNIPSGEQRLELIKAIESMIPEAKQLADKTPIIHLYGNLAVVHLNEYIDSEIAKFYLDSAMVYESQASDLGLAKLYIVAGSYHGLKGEIVPQQEYMYKSISYYEKVGGYFDERVVSLYSIALSYSYENDTTSMRQIMEKMLPLAEQAGTFKSFLSVYVTVAQYFSLLYYYAEYNHQPSAHYKDSVICSYSKIIRQYESYENPPLFFANNVAEIYLVSASMSLESAEPDMNQIAEYMEKALRLGIEAPLFRMRHCLLYSQYYMKLGQLDKALEKAQESLRLIEQHDEIQKVLHTEVYNMLSTIYMERNEYKQAFKYERLNSQVKLEEYDKERHQIVKDLQTRYEVAKKEEDIQRLTERAQYQDKIRIFTLAILILTILIFILAILWFRRKRKSDADALQIAQLKQQEAELNTEVETARREEKESQYNALAAEMEVKQIKYYLDGLEAERSRLAGELHDNVSNALLGVEFRMRTPGVSQEEISGILHGIHEQVRNISHVLMPPLFQHATLAEIITDYVYMQNDMTGPRFECRIAPEGGWEDLPQDMALELHRIVQEACGNALKHSGASLISISLLEDDGYVTLIVSDNGKGMDVSDKKSGLGLQIIRDRTAKMNGTVEITSAHGRGATITVKMRYPKP